ncbi:MAG: T9SS type A sorting domain-containing protein, partial [Phaeodactylibacter sp.]|nr:T9SS type A sorting domain-containing protein [Phaeodactylibacter sp.]
LNLAGKSHVFLSFDIRDNYEDNHPQDGLFFSNDGGATFHQVYAFRPQDWCDNTWGAFPPFSVDALAASAGLSLTSQFIIRFQQYDDTGFYSFTDGDGLVIDNVKVYSRPPVYTTLDFEDDFNSSNEFGSSWAWVHADSTVWPLTHTVRPTGFVGIVDGQGTGNSKGVMFGKGCDDGPTSNALDLHLDLAGRSHVFLSFNIRDNSEENHPQDGLFFSNDGGATFHQVYAFRAQDWCDNAWGAFPPFSVDALAASAGLSLTSQFIIRFQQYDDTGFYSFADGDGLVIDNVKVYSRPPVYATLDFEDDFDGSNEFGSSWAWVHADNTVAPLERTVKPTGFVGIVDGQGVNNSKGVMFGKSCDDGFASNALDLHLNLAGASDVLLWYSIRDYYEENHDEDGIYFSNDGGATFEKIYTFDFGNLPDNQFVTPPPLNLDNLTAPLGLSYSSQCIIRFQQYDDAGFYTSGDADGYILDNINVEGMVTGTHEEPAAESFCRIYPNPVSDQLTIALHLEIKGKSVRIFNAQGRMLYAEQMRGNHQATVDVSGLPSGLYLAEVATEEGVKILRKFVRR